MDDVPRRLYREFDPVVGGKLYVMEGWAWPFERVPRGTVYDAAVDLWCKMARGMREG